MQTQAANQVGARTAMSRRRMITTLWVFFGVLAAMIASSSPARADSGGAAAATMQTCHPAYRTCIPLVDGDLNCSDIGFQVDLRDPSIDPYRIDDGLIPGLGCELYPPADASSTPTTVQSITTTTRPATVLGTTTDDLADTGLTEDTAIIGLIALALGSSWVIASRPAPALRYFNRP